MLTIRIPEKFLFNMGSPYHKILPRKYSKCQAIVYAAAMVRGFKIAFYDKPMRISCKIDIFQSPPTSPPQKATRKCGFPFCPKKPGLSLPEGTRRYQKFCAVNQNNSVTAQFFYTTRAKPYATMREFISKPYATMREFMPNHRNIISGFIRNRKEEINKTKEKNQQSLLNYGFVHLAHKSKLVSKSMNQIRGAMLLVFRLRT